MPSTQLGGFKTQTHLLANEGTYLTRKTCPRPFLLRPWFLRLTVMVFLVFWSNFKKSKRRKKWRWEDGVSLRNGWMNESQMARWDREHVLSLRLSSHDIFNPTNRESPYWFTSISMREVNRTPDRRICCCCVLSSGSFLHRLSLYVRIWRVGNPRHHGENKQKTHTPSKITLRRGKPKYLRLLFAVLRYTKIQVTIYRENQVTG